MKLKKLSGTFLLLLFTICLSSCDDDNTTYKIDEPYLFFASSWNDVFVKFNDKTTNQELSQKIRTEMIENSRIDSPYFILIKNDAKTLLIFASWDDFSTGNILHEGTYSFEEDENTDKWIKLSYETNENAHYMLRPYNYEGIEGISAISQFFDLGWHDVELNTHNEVRNNALPELRLSPPPSIFVHLIEDFSEEYKSNYETVDSAYIRHAMTVLTH